MDPRSGIENTLARYCWAYDTNVFEQLAACFTPDAVISTQGSVMEVGRDAFVAGLQQRRAAYNDGARPWHVITNVLLSHLDGEKAYVNSRFSFSVVQPDEVHHVKAIGFYEDVFRGGTDGVWRIQERTIVSVG